MALNILDINEIDDERLAPYRAIREKDLVGRQHQFIAEGRVVLSVLLRSSQFETQSILVAANRLFGLMPLLEETQPCCPIYCAPQSVIDKIAGFNVHRGILGIGKRNPPLSFEEFLRWLPDNTLLPVVSGISNHDNMGSIFRNAAAFGVDGVIVDQICCDPLYRKSIRVSVGAALIVPYTQGESIDTIIDSLFEFDFDVFALSPSAVNTIDSVKRRKRTALLFGQEGEGLPFDVLDRVKGLRIPIVSSFDSLNVATASGIALCHFADPTRLR